MRGVRVTSASEYCICPVSKQGFILWSETCLIYEHREKAREEIAQGLWLKGDLG